MRNFVRWLVVSAALVAGACASPPPTADTQAASEFKTHVAAPSGSARVYILPTLSKGMFVDPEGRAGIAIFHDGSENGALLAWTAKEAFVAFDISPGTYDLMAYTDGSFTKFTKSLTFKDGSVYFFRPTFFRSAKDLSAAGGDAAAQSNGMGFEPVDFAAGSGEIQRMNMAPLRPDGQTFLAQARLRSAPPQVTAPTQGQPQPVVQAAPILAPPIQAAIPSTPTSAPAVAAPPPASPVALPQDNAFRVVEQKLKDLRRLRQEGLITKDEYDAKRRAILDAY